MRLSKTERYVPPMMITVLLLASAGPASLAQDGSPPAAATPPAERQLTQDFADDFQQDTRKDYTLDGDVEWQPGRLTLAEGASIRHTIDGSPWALVELNVGNSESKPEDTNGELRIWLHFVSAADCFVSFRHTRTGSQLVTSVAVVDTSEQDGEPVEAVVRDGHVPRLSGLVQVEYRYGLVNVSSGGRRLFAAHIDNGDAIVAGVRLESVDRKTVLSSLSASTYRQQHREYSDEEKAMLAEADKSERKLSGLYDEGKYAEAATIGEHVLDVRRRILGTEHLDYVASSYDLALVYDKLGDRSRAEPLYRETCDIEKRVLGTEHPDYAITLNRLAMLYEALLDYPRAERMYVEALNIRKQVFGTDHAKYATSVNNLALLYEAMGDYSRAEPLCIEALKIRKRVFGTKHPKYGSSLNNLAGLYESLEDFTRAEPLYIESLDIYAQVYGTEHPSYATVLNNLAFLYTRTGDYTRSESLLVRAQDIRKRIFGTEHLQYAGSLDNLAALYDITGRHVQARTLSCEAHRMELAVAAKTIPTLSEAQAARWMTENQPRTGSLLSRLSTEDGDDASAAYQAVWQTKSLASRLRLTRILTTDASPEAWEVFAQLRDARLNLAKLVSATPQPNKAVEYQSDLAAANDRKETAEKQLAELNVATRRVLAVRDANPEQLSAQLPAGVAIVDLARLNSREL